MQWHRRTPPRPRADTLPAVTPATDHFADTLTAAMTDKRSRVCVGIDPNYALLPAEITGEAGRRGDGDTAAVIDAFYAFTTGVLDAVAEHAAAVKFQSAYFEQYHAEGVEAYFALIQEAKTRGLVVIGDAKRGDIGATSAAYATGHLVPHAADDLDTADALTVNPMMGLDTLTPFVETARAHGKGLFVLVRTSNPGSAALQDATLADGRTWSRALAEALAPVADEELGSCGYSSVGAVVGATQPHTLADLRAALPRSIFLLPGYGAQGATAEMVTSAFNADGLGALVSASRSVTYAEPTDGEPWQHAVQRAAAKMQADLNEAAGL